MRTAVLVLVLLGLARAPVHADVSAMNALAGPVLGIRLGGPESNGRIIIGLEGGVGWGPHRINLGFTRRLEKTFGYMEFAPWLLAGLSFGFGMDSDGVGHPVIGVWEGVPVEYPGCGDTGYAAIVTIAAGYRFTGVHELYVTLKAGGTKDGDFCWD